MHNYRVLIFLFRISQFLDLLASPISSDYQPITEKEATDLKQMMENCEYAVSNAELFMEKLSKDLSILDGVKESHLFKLILYSIKDIVCRLQ